MRGLLIKIHGYIFRYIIKGQKIKENIILNRYIENFSVKYNFKVKDLVLKELDGEFVFVNELDEVISL